MIVAIAAAHGIFVILFGRTRFSLAVAALISGAVGVMVGNPAYLSADLLGVAIGYFIGRSLVDDAKPVITKEIKLSKPVKLATCPHCKTSLQVESASHKRFKCPICAGYFDTEPQII